MRVKLWREVAKAAINIELSQCLRECEGAAFGR